MSDVTALGILLAVTPRCLSIPSMSISMKAVVERCALVLGLRDLFVGLDLIPRQSPIPLTLFSAYLQTQNRFQHK
jgi:hypothetical protein